MISVHFQGKPFNTTVIQAYAPNTNSEKAQDEWFYEDLQDLLELTPNKWCTFHHRGLECKSRKSRETCSNRQVWPWCKKWSRLIEFCQENVLVIANALFHQHNTRDDSTHGHDQMVNTEIRLIIFFSAEDGEALYRQQKQDRELTVAQIMNSLLQNSDWNWNK